MSQALLLFACTFGTVFALGLQQLNVVGGHRLLAAITSLLIGLFQMVLYKLVPQPTDMLSNIGYLFGGPVGIVVAMACHPILARVLGRKPKDS